MASVYKFIFLVSILIINSEVSESTGCSSLYNVKMSIHTTDNENQWVKINNGCVERVAFVNKAVTEIYIRGQKIPRLGRDSVRHMVRLSVVAIEDCQMETIEPGAFRNVPKLQKLKITKNNITKIAAGIFQVIEGIDLLELSNNNIKSIEPEAFANLPSLRRFHCNNNSLESFDAKWFTNSTNLKIIDFSYNKIKNLPKKSFSGFPKLREIYLGHNEIDSILPEAFKGIKKLDYLGLSYNRLRTIDPSIFPNEIEIRYFHIDANYLNYLSADVLKKAEIGEIALGGNPWICPCLDLIFQRLLQHNVTRIADSCTGGDVPVCSYSSSYSKTCNEIVDKDVTDTYLNELRQLDSKLDTSCARLD